MHSIDGRARLAELARPLLGQLPQGTFRRMMEQALEQRIGVAVDLPAAAPEERPRATLKARPQSPGTMPPIRRAVALLLQHPEIAEQTLPEGWESIDQPGIDVLHELHRRILDHPGTSSAALVEGTEDPRLRGHLAQLAVAELAVQDDAGEQLCGILRRLIEQQLTRQRRQLLKNTAPSSMSEEEKQRLRELYRRP
jgi:DNA primase